MSTTDPTGAPRPLAVGDQLGQYKLVELLAIGGMGLVYRAYDALLDRYVAIKVLAPELARDPEIARRFLNEARAAAALNHPNIVHIYTAGEQAGHVFFAMELVTGEQIETLLARQHQLPVREAVEFIRQAALGLQHAHQHGLIHSDVKPANFLVSDTGTLKVSDFGLVRHVKAAPGTAETESLYGTPGYISPEVITGHAPDQRSDIYSLGATLFHMLAGQPPFVGATPDETLHLHTQAPVPSIQTLNSNVPVALAQIVTRMLAKKPEARYQSYAELLQTLDRYLGERHLAGARLLNDSGPKQSPARAPAPPPRRESPLSAILTLISVIACGVIVFLVYRVQFAGKPTVAETPKPVPAPAGNLEVQAANELKTLRLAAESAAADGQLGRADEIYAKWPADQFAGTSANQAINAERIRLRSIAGQQWHAAQAKIKTLWAAGKFADAIAVCDRQARACAGFADLPDEIAGLRRKIEQEQQTKIAATAKAAANTAAAAEAAVTQVRQAKLQQLQAELTVLITGLQWDKGRQVVQTAIADTGQDAVLRQELGRWQSEFDCLLALRAGMSARLKIAPSAPVTLTTKRGELKGQVSGFDAHRIILRETFGAVGFAETAIAWSDLTPASVCRIFFTGLDAGQPEETVGYAVLLAEQALAKQARPEDARQTLQAVAARVPAYAGMLQVYLNQFAEPERPAPAPPAREPEPPAMVEHVEPKGFVPLDIGAACNASFFEHGEIVGNKIGFSRNAFIGDLPDHGRVPLRDTEPGGIFQLRTADKPDTISLAWATGRFPASVIVKLPAAQQRRYSQLAVLSASSIAGATLSARFTYDTGEPEELKFKTFDWTNLHPSADANVAVAVAAVKPPAKNPGQFYWNLIEMDKQRRLTSIAFTWISAGTENPQHCVGIFAISGLPAE